MNIYVGNLAWKTRQKELKELFENFGEVTNAFIVRDKVTRRSRGFGFVEMANEQDALQAIEKLNNTVFHDRSITVNEALPRDDEGDQADPVSEGSEEDETGEMEAAQDESTGEAAAEDEASEDVTSEDVITEDETRADVASEVSTDDDTATEDPEKTV